MQVFFRCFDAFDIRFMMNRLIGGDAIEARRHVPPQTRRHTMERTCLLRFWPLC